ncbi:hypothetical protein [Marinicellulosiphila megalodicopiae]|uniref:hypothetical protein n=1 Tax=Marinicellulosiphila megalodicopiae TaxID=2724896 RepID=UPI003BB011FE
MNLKQLKDEVIIPTLDFLDLNSESAVNLLIGTVCAESAGGKDLKQLGGGPALGIYQMEPATHDDIFKNYLAYKPELMSKVLCLSIVMGEGFTEGHRQLVFNLVYATAMARIHYLRVKESLPRSTNVIALAEYWKKYYNTHKGAGTVDHFIESYQRGHA